MTGMVSIVRCPKCLKLLIEFADIPVYKCGACSTVLHAKGYNLTKESVTSRSGSRSRNIPLSSDQSILSSSNKCPSPSSNNKGILHEKVLLSTHEDWDETSPLHLECKQNESIDKIMNAHYKDEENGNPLEPGELSFASTLEKNVATVLNSQTSRGSYTYDASISSIDDTFIDHILNRNQMMSMRTFGLQKLSKLVSNISKGGEEDCAQPAEHPFSKIPLKSRTNSNETTDESNVCVNRKLQSLKCNLHSYKQQASVESLPFSSQVEFENRQTSHLMASSFISNALRNLKQDHIELSSNMYDMKNLHVGHQQCSSHPSHSSCCSSSKCSSCSYDIHHSSLIEEVEKINIKDKRYQTKRQCRPISNGAPFVICSECFELLRLPIDLLVSKRGTNKLQCGACSKIVVLQIPSKNCSTSNNFADAKTCPKLPQPIHPTSNASFKLGNYLQVRDCEQELLPTLHQLMGYFSATEVLYQVTDVDEGYESSEPAMPDSYRNYEEQTKKKLLLRYSEDKAYFDSVEVEEEDSPKFLNKKKQSHLHSIMKGKIIET